MVVTNAAATPAELVTEMMAHAVTKEGMEQIYPWPALPSSAPTS